MKIDVAGGHASAIGAEASRYATGGECVKHDSSECSSRQNYSAFISNGSFLGVSDGIQRPLRLEKSARDSKFTEKKSRCLLASSYGNYVLARTLTALMCRIYLGGLSFLGITHRSFGLREVQTGTRKRGRCFCEYAVEQGTRD